MLNNFHNNLISSNQPVKSLRLSRPMLNLIFISALVFLLILSVGSYTQVKALIRESDWVIHSHEVIQNIDAALYEIVDIESHNRAYYITGQEYFLGDIDTKKSQLKKSLENLNNLTKDNPDQNQRVLRFITLTEQRLLISNKILQLKITNKLFTQEGLELFSRSQDASSRVKGLGQEIKSVERVLLQERTETVLNSANITSLILIFGNAFGIALLIFVIILANRELSARKETEYHNKNTQDRLRKIIESSNDMIAAFDKEERLIIFNDSYQREFKRLFGKPVAVGMQLEEALINLPENRHEIAQLWKESLHSELYEKTIECVVEHKKNIYEISSSLIQNGDNSIQGAVQSIRNITKRIEEHSELQHSYEQLAIGMKALEIKNEQITLLVEMSDIMLACSSQKELTDVMENYSKQLLQFASGYLYIMHPSKNYLEKAASWGNPNAQDTTFSPDECWGIRLGRIHQINLSHQALHCEHIHSLEEKKASLLCIPLMAQNDIYGLLYLEIIQDISPLEDENQKLLITAFSELTALSLANVRLRENLRYQSIRDPLTGLYNRRYLEDFLFKQISQAQRTKSPLSLIMLDLDHFKKINDTYGHDAGDAALKEVASILQHDIREGDIASRYGGEEFLILLYDIDLESTRTRAENIRKEVSKLQIKYGAQAVGPITVSLGISSYPIDGKTPDELIDSADKALYYAKNHGRNQVVLFCELNQKTNR